MNTKIFTVITFAILCVSTTAYAMLSAARRVIGTIDFKTSGLLYQQARSYYRPGISEEQEWPTSWSIEEYRKKVEERYASSYGKLHTYTPAEVAKNIDEHVEEFTQVKKRVEERERAEQEKIRTEPRAALIRVEKQLEEHNKLLQQIIAMIQDQEDSRLL
jgi:hypothetical protein